MKVPVICVLLMVNGLCASAQIDTTSKAPVDTIIKAPVDTVVIGPAPEIRSSAPWFVQRFRVSAGLFVPVNNTKIQVDNADGTKGTTIDFENDLGYEKTTATFLADLQWRISRRSRLDLSYYHIDRNSEHQIQKDIEFKDHVYPVNANVNSFFNTDIYRLSYGYAFFSRPKFEAGVIVGAHVVRASVGMALNTSVGNASVSDDFGFTAPLPDVGIWGGYAFNPRWAITAEVSYLSLNVDNVSGRILSYNIYVLYDVVKNFTLSLGYTGLNFNVGVEKDKANGSFKWGYNGPSLVASFAFGKKKW